MQEYFTSMFTYAGSVFSSFFGDFHYLGLFLISLILLLLLKKEKTRRRYLISYCMIVLLLFVFPLFCYYVSVYAIGYDTYWRILWLLPIVPLIAYGFTAVTASVPFKAARPFLAALLVLLVITTGTTLFSPEIYTTVENEYKLPKEIPQLCDGILRDSRYDTPTVAFPDELIPYVRQYTGKIMLPYGRSFFQGNQTEESQLFFLVLNSTEELPSRLVSLALTVRCDYFVLSNDDPRTQNLILRDYGATPVFTTEHYIVFRTSVIRVNKDVNRTNSEEASSQQTSS